MRKIESFKKVTTEYVAVYNNRATITRFPIKLIRLYLMNSMAELIKINDGCIVDNNDIAVDLPDGTHLCVEYEYEAHKIIEDVI